MAPPQVFSLGTLTLVFDFTHSNGKEGVVFFFSFFILFLFSPLFIVFFFRNFLIC